MKTKLYKNKILIHLKFIKNKYYFKIRWILKLIMDIEIINVCVKPYLYI